MLTPPDIPVHVNVTASLATFDIGGQVTEFAGVPMWKLAADLGRYASVIAATRPQVLVETGTMWGGSALWFECQGLDVVTVDVDSTPVNTAYRLCERTTFVVGDSTDPVIVERVAAQVDGRRCMVVLDSEHSAPHVAAEIRAYGPLVSPGCYLVVEDGIFDLAPTPEGQARGGALLPVVGGPLRAVADVLAPDPCWRRDEAIEKAFPLSYFPAGWWMRE